MQIFTKNFILISIIGFVFLIPWIWDYVKDWGKTKKIKFYERILSVIVYLLPLVNVYMLYTAAAVYLYKRKTFLFLPILFEPTKTPELMNLTWSIIIYNLFIRNRVVKLSYFIRFHITHSILLNILQGFIDQVLLDIITPRRRTLLLGHIYVPVLEPFFSDPQSPYFLGDLKSSLTNVILMGTATTVILSILAFYILTIFEAMKGAATGNFICRNFFLKAITFYIGDKRSQYGEKQT